MVEYLFECTVLVAKLSTTRKCNGIFIFLCTLNSPLLVVILSEMQWQPWESLVSIDAQYRGVEALNSSK